MGYNLSDLPDSVKSKIAPEIRTELGFHAQTTAEARDKYERGLEKEMHERFIQWLNYSGISFVHSRMDKPASIQKGWPDFTLLRDGKAVLVEFKTPENDLTADQADVCNGLRGNGMTVFVARDLGMAIKEVSRFFGV